MTQILFIVDTGYFENKGHEELLRTNLHGLVLWTIKQNLQVVGFFKTLLFC
jgi:hypothetical protein